MSINSKTDSPLVWRSQLEGNTDTFFNLYTDTHTHTHTHTRTQGTIRCLKAYLDVQSLPGKRKVAVAGRLAAPDQYRSAFTAVLRAPLLHCYFILH